MNSTRLKAIYWHVQVNLEILIKTSRHMENGYSIFNLADDLRLPIYPLEKIGKHLINTMI